MKTIRPVKVRETGFAPISSGVRSLAVGAMLAGGVATAGAQCLGTTNAITAYNADLPDSFVGPLFVSPIDGSLQFAIHYRNVLTRVRGTMVSRLDGIAWIVEATEGLRLRDPIEGAFDPSRGKLVVFGGWNSGELDDTWEWDGRAWRECFPTGARPRARHSHAMAFDPLRQRIVLYGGKNINQSLYDTWEWDGVVWELRSTVSGGSSEGTTMVFDPVTQRMLRYGGSAPIRVGLTFAWDGASWTQVASTGPYTNFRCSLAVDPVRGRVVLFGGATSGTTMSSTWEWSGTEWTLRASVGPPGRSFSSMCVDPTRGQIVMAGGQPDPLTAAHDMWAWNGQSWSQIPFFESLYQSSYAIDRLRRKVVMFSGASGTSGSSQGTPRDLTREWDGTTWRNVSVSGPPPRRQGAMAWHAGLGQVVLFGGLDASGQRLSDTWAFDGHAWTRLPVQGPAARTLAAMAWDAMRDRIVMFGGSGATGYLGDTWEFDGAAWHQAAVVGPPPRVTFMGFDERIGKCIVYGGYPGAGGVGRATDTWAWDGQSWEALPVPPGPSDAVGWLTFDSISDRLLFLNTRPSTSPGTYELTSRGWRPFATISSWIGFDAGAILHDPVSNRLLCNIPATTGNSNLPLLMLTTEIIRPAIISPDVIEQPAAVTAHHNTPVTLSVRASGTPPFTYQWRRNQSPLADGPRISGATVDTLRIDPADAADSGEYDCVVANECAQIESFPGTVQVACAADFNQDGGVDGADVEAFFVAWENADPSSDLNADGGIDGGDVEYFFTRWEAGC